MTVRHGFAIVPALLLAMAQTAGAADALGRYEKVRKIEVGGEGGWDFLTVDPGAHRLYVARATRVMVVDLDKDAVVGEIPDTPGVHGIALVPDLGRGFTSNGRDASVTVFDTKTLKTLGKITVGEKPDIIHFDPGTKRVFTFNHGTKDATAIDPAAMKVVGTLPLGGMPELAVTDKNGHIFVNIEDTSELVEFDPEALKVLHRYPLAPGEEPTGLALDPEARRLFSTCANEKLVILDADTGKVTQTLKIGPGPDGCVFDAEKGLVFSSNGGDGTLSIIEAESPGRYRVAKTVKTQVSAKTIDLDPKTHRLYLSAATAAPDPEPAPAVAPGTRRRSTFVPGSFVILVVGD